MGVLAICVVVFLIVLPLVALVLIVAWHFYGDQVMDGLVFAGQCAMKRFPDDVPYGLSTWFVETPDGQRLEVGATKTQAATLVFYLHGNGGDLVMWAPILHDLALHLPADYALATFDYRGYGRSTGAPSQATLISDAEVVLKSLEEKFERADILLYGRSLGGYVALHLAAAERGSKPLRNLFLETPFMGTHALRVPFSTWLHQRFECASRVSKLRAANVACVLGSADPLIHADVVKTWLAPLGNCHVLHGAYHNDCMAHSEFQSIFTEWISRARMIPSRSI